MKHTVAMVLKAVQPEALNVQGAPAVLLICVYLLQTNGVVRPSRPALKCSPRHVQGPFMRCCTGSRYSCPASCVPRCCSTSGKSSLRHRGFRRCCRKLTGPADGKSMHHGPIT